MSATIKFLIISAAIIIPWGIIRLADWEVRIIAFLGRIPIGDLGILAMLVLPPLALLVLKWLFAPRGKKSKRYSGHKDILIKFRE